MPSRPTSLTSDGERAARSCSLRWESDPRESPGGHSPKREDYDYVAKAKATLTPEQLTEVEKEIKKAEAERKAMMEKWRAHELKENKEQPGTPQK